MRRGVSARLGAALALLLTLLTTSPAGAAGSAPDPRVVPFTVPATVLQPAEDLLARLDVLEGDGRGKYREGDALTRAEMAALIVRTLGLGDEARALAKQKPTFQDLKGHWAAGEVAMAAQQHLMNGYPDGSFQPNRLLSYAEALTVLERALHLQPQGSKWPDNILATAASAKLVPPALRTAIVPDAAALRGVLFVLLAGSLERPDSSGRTLLSQITGANAPALAAHLDVTGVDTTQDHVRVIGNVSGALLVTVAGMPVTVQGGSFAVDVPLSLGNNSILVLATSMDDRQVSQQLHITRLMPNAGAAGGS